MKNFSLISAAANLVWCAFATMPTDGETQFGLTFSPTTITASRFESSASISLMKFPASTEYQYFFRNAIDATGASRPDTIDVRDFQSIVDETLPRPLMESLQENLGHAPEFTSLVLPSILQGRARHAASDAVFKGATYVKIYAPLIKPRAGHECNESGTGQHTYYDDGKRLCVQCGDKYREQVGDKAYRDQVNAFVKDFVNDQVLARHKREDVRAIVVVGNQSAPAIDDLSSIARDAIGTDVVKVMMDFDPSEVATRGAAVMARMAQRADPSTVTYSGNIIPDEQYWAEEEALKQAKAQEHEEL